MRSQGASRERHIPGSVTVVVPVLDAAATIEDQLRALLNQDFAGTIEVIVADNGSSDGTLDIVHSWRSVYPDKVRIIDAADCRGPNHARNVGARAASHELILFTDADDVASSGWVKGMINASPKGDVLAGRVDHFQLDPIEASWKRTASFNESLVPMMGFLPHASGGNCGVWLDVFKAVGGFDVEQVEGTNDVGLSWKAQLAGYRLHFVRDAVVFARPRATFPRVLRQHLARGRGEVLLFRDYRSFGVPRRNPLRCIIEIGWLFVTMPVLLSPRHRTLWGMRAGLRTGRVQGSFRYRALFV